MRPIKSAYTFEKTNIYYNYDENNLASIIVECFWGATAVLFSNSLWSSEKVYETGMKRKASYEIQKKQSVIRNISSI
jgi:cobalt-zinc-cadmium resistance protein CzcA